MRFTIAPFLAALLAGASGCGSGESRPEGVTLFLFDASWSCKNLREQFRRDFRSKLMRMEGVRVFVDLIGASRVPEYPIIFEIPARKGPLAQYRADFDRERAQIADAADAEVLALFQKYDDEQMRIENERPGTTGNSDVVLTLSLVTLFQRDELRDSKNKELCLFTDGVQQSPDLDVTLKKLTPSEVSNAVEKLHGKGLVPNLTGVTVRVGGLVAGKGKQLSSKQIIVIRRFWCAYFEKSDARFNPANLDGTVMD